MKQIIITILLLVFFARVHAQTKLIVIYDESCSYCQNLLQKTYKDEKVIEKLNDYDVKMHQVNSIEGKKYIEALEIKDVPAQIFISDTITGKDIVISGFQEVKEQLKILENPLTYANKRKKGC